MWRKDRREASAQFGACRNIVRFDIRTHIRMCQDDLSAKAGGSGSKRVLNVTEQQIVLWRRAVGETVGLAIQHIDLALREMDAQVVVGATVTQTHLEHNARTDGYLS